MIVRSDDQRRRETVASEGTAVASAETATRERELVVATALDYFEGHFDGDVERMDRALHPNLVKRAPRDESAAELGITTKERMLELTRAHVGANEPDDHTLDVEVLEVYKNIATVIVRSAPYREYLHLVKTSDGWRIANALFCET
jgi:hypothetical protein